MFPEVPDFDWDALDAEQAKEEEMGLDANGWTPPCEPTDVLPGPGKIEVFAARYAAGLSLFSPDDAKFGDRTGLQLRRPKGHAYRMRPAEVVPVREGHRKPTPIGSAVKPDFGDPTGVQQERYRRFPSYARTDAERERDKLRKRTERAAASVKRREATKAEDRARFRIEIHRKEDAAPSRQEIALLNRVDVRTGEDLPPPRAARTGGTGVIPLHPDLAPPPALVARDQRPWATLAWNGDDFLIGCDTTFELDGAPVGCAAFFAGLKTLTKLDVHQGWVTHLAGRSGE